jgi:uncharacterized protein YeaO (DUF488 family)
MIKLKRAYQAAEESDGVRVLVDSLWPRGVTKERAAIEWWAKELAPSAELRRWFGHDPVRFAEFAERYLAELDVDGGGNDALAKLKEMAKTRTVTLVYGARDTEHNQAVVLAGVLTREPVTA